MPRMASLPRSLRGLNAMALQKLLLIARHPSEYLRFSIQRLNQIVDVEIYHDVRTALADIGRRPRDMSHAMKLVDRRDSDATNAHVTGPEPAIVFKTLPHHL